ncbi:MAG: DUF4136 domain-containing protein [Prevotellaceae bacterium]|jgi:hypothetical protein|nr:DUF4136 domain-containing protein [Prevotellaceae bacterium]
MYQKTTKTEAGADFNSAMEQKPLEKRAILKNHKSRRNLKVLMLLFFLLPVSLFAQKNGKTGFIFVNGNSNWGKDYKVIYYVDPLHVKSNSLKIGDIITHVDGVSTYQIDNAKFTNLCRGEVGSEAEFTVLRMGNPNPVKVRITRKLDEGYPAELDYALKIIDMNWKSNDLSGWKIIHSGSNNQYQALSDREIDFFNYRTFDFEYTSQKQPLEEKNLAAVVEKILESKGLTRDRENPDMLVLLDFFSDKKEQYIPPTEQIQTRYRTHYNVFTKRYESRQYISSSTEGDYTKTEYLTSLDIIFMDAKKAKDGNSNVPPVIWSASYENISYNKPVILSEAQNCYPVMLNFYPFVGWQYDFAYCDWGIYVDTKYSKTIAKVLPNSFAEKIGLQKDDIIQLINFVNFQKMKDPSITSLMFAISNTHIGQIKVKRNGKTKSFKLNKNMQPPVKRIVITLPAKE